MRYTTSLLSSTLFISAFAALALAGCSAEGGDPVDSSGGGDTGSGGASSGGAVSGSGGAASGGSSSGGAASGGADNGSGGADSGSGGAPTGDCTPNPSGTFVVEGDLVFDEKTCLTWMKINVTGHPYVDAEAYCEGLSLGGYEDFRLPTAGEVVSIFNCNGTYPPPLGSGFEASGDGIWTTTETGTIAGNEAKVCGAGQLGGQFYDFGKVGAQNTRCVRGPVTLPDRADCKTNTSICG